MTEYKLPDLPYKHDELEPIIPKKIMKLHHLKHHQNYVNGLNTLLKQLKEPECHIGELIILIHKDMTIDKKLKDKILFNAGGHYNHSFYWKCMTRQETQPNITLMAQIVRDFGSMEEFKEKHLQSIMNTYEVGWHFLCFDTAKSKLTFLSTTQHGTPLVHSLLPILACDLWEHAWYLKYTVNKKKFLTKWQTLINWDNISVFYDMAVRAKNVDFLSDGNVDLFIGDDK